MCIRDSISTTPVLFDSKVTTDPVEKPTAKIEAVDDDDLDDEEDAVSYTHLLEDLLGGTGKAEDAKPPGAGIIPKLCPMERANTETMDENGYHL